MKKVIFLVFVLAASVAVYAQSSGAKTGFSGGVRFALPLGNFHLTHSVGIGAELQAEHKLSPNTSLTGTTGYTNFIGKSEKYSGYNIKYDAVGYIPLLVGARYYPTQNVFVGGKAGYGILTGSGGAFNFEPQIGYNTEKFQLALGYNALVDDGTLGHLGVSAVYKFN